MFVNILVRGFLLLRQSALMELWVERQTNPFEEQWENDELEILGRVISISDTKEQKLRESKAYCCTLSKNPITNDIYIICIKGN